MQVIQMVRKMVRNPYFDLVIGLILIASGLMEVLETLPNEISDWKLGAHHGVVFLGLLTVLRSMADIFAGVDFLDERSKVLERKQEKVR